SDGSVKQASCCESSAGFGRSTRRSSRAFSAPYLTSPLPSYISLFSALAEHEMIEQIPRQISLVAGSTAPDPDQPRRLRNPPGRPGALRRL
ncbi:MAG TPA: hypothetical protein VKH20_02265, partial [Solirubrobacterales bacterium]|nr:hypothetical protein [Solirubrobacterales bacterium]